MDFLKGGFNSLKNEESNLYATKMSTKQSLTFYILTYGTSHMTDQWTVHHPGEGKTAKTVC